MKSFPGKPVCLIFLLTLLAFSAQAAIVTIFSDDFESYANNTALTAAYLANTMTGLSTAQAHSGTQSVADLTCTVQGVLTGTLGASYHSNNGYKIIATFWLYDVNGSGTGCTGSTILNGRSGLTLAGYSGGTWGSGTLENYVFLGTNHLTSTTNYCANVLYGGSGWQATSIARTVGWHKMIIELDNETVRFYVDDILGLTDTYTEPAGGWNSFRLGSPTGGPYMYGYYDDLKFEVIGGPVAFVDDGGSGNYTTLDSAIRAFSVGGERASITPPYTIKIKAGSGPYDERISLDDSLTSHNLAGDLTIESDTPGVLVPIALQADLAESTPPSVNSAGLHIYSNDKNITLRDLLIYPSRTANQFRCYIIKIDENNPNSIFNTITLDNCIITEVGVSGNPLITTRIQAYDPPGEASDSSRDNTNANTVQYLGDAGESLNVVISDCVLYGAPATGAGSANHLRAAFAGQDGESLTITNTLMAYGPAGHGIRFGQTDNYQGALTIEGLEVYNSPSTGGNHLVSFEGTQATGSYPTTATIKNTMLVRDNNLDTATCGIYGGSATNIKEIDKLITITSAPGIVNTTTDDSTWTNLTIHNNSTAGNNAFYLFGGSGSITCTNAIFSGPGIKLAGTVPSGGLNVDCSAFAEEGPDAITARDSGAISVSYGTKIINWDPMYVSKDIDNAEFMFVDNIGYAAAACGDAPLGGGASYKGLYAEVTGWFLF